MKHYLSLFFFLFSITLHAQSVVDFEEFDLDPESYLNGSDGSGGFQSGDLFLPNIYDAYFMSWTGWAISNTTDVTTPGFMNQYSAITGTGVDGSDHYAVTYSYTGSSAFQFTNAAIGNIIPGLYVTNSTYTYLSMLNGDGFAKKFGGASGNDPDFFKITFRGYSGGLLQTDSVEFYLADYRFEDNELDYIVDEWTYVNLTPLGAIDSLYITFASSDVSTYGINTPQYFCIDDVFAEAPVSTKFVQVPDLFEVFPNPADNFIRIQHREVEDFECSLYSITGQLLFKQQMIGNFLELDLSAYPPGSYLIRLKGAGKVSSELILIQ